MARFFVTLAFLSVASAGCASKYDRDWHSVLQLDACAATPIPQPVDLQARAQALGCAYSSTGAHGVLELTVKAVCSPREFVVSGRYGLERIRVAYGPPAASRLAVLDTRELAELRSSLDQELSGRVVLEEDNADVPVVSDDGLRSVHLWTADFHDLDELVTVQIESLPRARHTERPEGRAVPDLAQVPRALAARRDRVKAIVELAERFSPFRASPDLSVEWIDFANLPALDSTTFDAWRGTVGTCFAEDEVVELNGLDAALGLSFPGGHVFLPEDHDWREIELRYVLLHELMHQHEYDLCTQGQVPFAELPDLLMQAYADSMAREILRRSGTGPETLQLVRDWGGCSGETQVFDEFRSGLGLSPDECLLYLAKHVDEAKRLAKGGYVAMLNCPHDGRFAFEWVGSSASGNAIVNVVNTTSQPCSIYSTGWWHFVTTATRNGEHMLGETRNGERMVGGTPFALRLPPHGSIKLLTAMHVAPDVEVTDCHVVYAVTPAPLFDETRPSMPSH